MFSPDLTKMFDPQNFTKNMQQFFDMNSAVAYGQKNMESLKKLNSIWADTYANCCEKQLKLCQSAMEDSIECMRDLSTAKGVEDYMGKQAEWSRKLADKCQSGIQDITNMMQKSQTQSTDIISTMVSTGVATTTKAATKYLPCVMHKEPPSGGFCV